MNKTVNINLANVLFHIDEDAYNKMRRYLESVKKSFNNTAGSDEIIADIEARIAELFHEKLANERQVITEKEVDEVISIMGQPEDYMVDEDIFEDEPTTKREKKSTKSKKLYRDIEHKYVAGVSSGLGHYFGVDPLWVRLAWVALTIGSSGGFILIYGLLWVLMPEARTTSEKLDMRGETVNISNIERKVKEGFDDVAEKVKNADYSKVAKTGKSFFDTVGDIIMFFFKIFGKFIGIILIVIGATAIIASFIGMITMGTLDWISIPGIDGIRDSLSEGPVWLYSLLAFFAISIPFFFLMYLGLKILVTNLKSIGNIAKFSLLGLWLLSIISLIVLGVREAAAHAFEGGITQKEQLFEIPNDTLIIEINQSNLWENDGQIRFNDAAITYDENGDPILISDDVHIRVKKSKSDAFHIQIRKEANGNSVLAAREMAEKIEYNYETSGNTLTLNDFLTITGKRKFREQEVHVTIYVPEGKYIDYKKNDRRWLLSGNTNREDLQNMSGYVWKMAEDAELKCQNCPEIEMDEDDQENHISIDENGVDINVSDDGEKVKIKIDQNGVKINANDTNDSVNIKINGQGVKVDANN